MRRAPAAAAGRRRVEAVDVGQQHQAVGAHHAGDAGGEAVVVAVADLGGGHRVVLVDDRDGALGQQRVDGLARVEIAAALLGVAQRQQDLRGGEPARLEHGLVGAGERDLPDGGGGLRFLELQRALGEAQHVPAERDGAGRHDDHLLAGLDERGNVVGQRVEPGGFELPARPVDQQARADLDDDAARLGPLGPRLCCRALGFVGGCHGRLAGSRVVAGRIPSRNRPSLGEFARVVRDQRGQIVNGVMRRSGLGGGLRARRRSPGVSLSFPGFVGGFLGGLLGGLLLRRFFSRLLGALGLFLGALLLCLLLPGLLVDVLRRLPGAALRRQLLLHRLGGTFGQGQLLARLLGDALRRRQRALLARQLLAHFAHLVGGLLHACLGELLARLLGRALGRLLARCAPWPAAPRTPSCVARSRSFAARLRGLAPAAPAPILRLRRPPRRRRSRLGFEGRPVGCTHRPFDGQRRSRHGDEQPRHDRHPPQTSPAHWSAGLAGQLGPLGRIGASRDCRCRNSRCALPGRDRNSRARRRPPPRCRARSRRRPPSPGRSGRRHRRRRGSRSGFRPRRRPPAASSACRRRNSATGPSMIMPSPNVSSA